MKVIVVGAGVIGASVAFRLARAGAEVTVIDAGVPAASNTSFGWINASFYADESHHHLRAASIAAYGRMMDVLRDLPVAFCGALWWEEQGAGLRDMQASLAALGYPVDAMRCAEVAQIEPDIKGLPAEVLQFPSEAAAEAGDLARALRRASGARYLRGVTVNGVATREGQVCGVNTSVGRIASDRVVIAAGNGAPDILREAGVTLPMLTRPGVLVTTKPVRARIAPIMVTPHGEARQLADGRLLASAVANHQGDESSEVTDTPDAIAVRVLDWLGPLVGEDLVCDEVALAYRPVPQDGLPVIGAVGPSGLHVAVMHSGVTLAAIVGEAVAAEVLGQGGFDDMLAPYRPQRFQ